VSSTSSLPPSTSYFMQLACVGALAKSARGRSCKVTSLTHGSSFILSLKNRSKVLSCFGLVGGQMGMTSARRRIPRLRTTSFVLVKADESVQEDLGGRGGKGGGLQGSAQHLVSCSPEHSTS